MKVNVINKSDKQVFLELGKEHHQIIPIGSKAKVTIDIESDTELIELQKKYRKKLIFRKI